MLNKIFTANTVAVMVLLALSSDYSLAQEQAHHELSHNEYLPSNESVMIVTQPADSPLHFVMSPKLPRQPLPASDGSDYLKVIPGFSQIRNGGTNGDPVFRGMFGSRLRILTNGGEMLGACPARMDAPSSYISPEGYDLFTLIKGPQTVLWGPGNSAATLHFERAAPRFDQANVTGTVSVLSASNARWDENADVSVGNREGYLRLIGNFTRSNDYKDGNNTRVPSKWDKKNADLILGWTPDNNTLLEVTAGKGDGEARYAGRSMDGSQFKRDTLGMRFEKSDISEIFDKLEANIYYNYANHIMDNYSLRSPAGGGHSVMESMEAMDMMPSMNMSMPMEKQLDRRTVGGRVMATWIWSSYELRSGADMQINTHRTLQKAGWEKDARFDDYGIFGELTLNTTDGNKLIGGVRMDWSQVDNYTHNGSSERTEVLPAAFVRYEYTLPNAPAMLYAGIGYTERFPDYWELFSPTYGPTASLNVIDHLKTEKNAQIDFGAQYNGKKINSWVSGYIGRINDYILFQYDPLNAHINQVENINANILGGEAGMSYSLTDEWKTDISIAYSWGKNTSDKKPLPQIPPLETRLGITWAKGHLSSTGLLRLVDGQHRISQDQGNVVGKDFTDSKGFAVISMNAAYKVNETANISAGVDNLLNRAYNEHLNLAGNSSFGYASNTIVNEPGRIFWAKLNIKF
jgi:iron complex outermembrane receptor protein